MTVLLWLSLQLSHCTKNVCWVSSFWHDYVRSIDISGGQDPVPMESATSRNERKDIDVVGRCAPASRVPACESR